MTEADNAGSEPARQAVPHGFLHELRTPLNQIIGYSEMLLEERREQGSGDVTKDLKKIRAAGGKLLALIEGHFYPASGPGSAAPTPLPALPAESGEAQIAPEKISLAVAGHAGLGTGPGLILVVDDIEANRDVLSRRLERQGHSVSMAENGREALEKLRSETFDLVLLDIMMPEMDGYEVLRQLKADEVLRRTPVIMISALSELDSVVRCIELGAEDYLPKPFNPILLKARIGACLEKKRLRDGERRLLGQLREKHDRLEELAAALHLRNSEMARWRQAQEADLAIARTTQQAVVSSPPPLLHGWQVEAVYTPLIQVGGDVYGWRQLDRDAWLFWLADATGHGVSAALFTTLVASLFDRAGAASTTARGILARVNAEFHSVLHGRSFMTACCAVLTGDGRLSFAGAGHPPLLVRRSHGEVEAFPSLNMIMGIDPVAEMTETTTSLAAGDVALLFTDGLHSLKSKDGERLTTGSVAGALTGIGGSADFLSRLISELGRQSDAQPLDDDLTAIALRRV